MADVPTHRFPAGVHDLHVDMIRQFQLQMEQMQARREFHRLAAASTTATNITSISISISIVSVISVLMRIYRN